MKRTLMLKNQELLDFEIDLVTGEVRVLDAPDASDPLLASLGFGGSARDATVTATIGSRRLSRVREDIDEILGASSFSKSRFSRVAQTSRALVSAPSCASCSMVRCKPAAEHRGALCQTPFCESADGRTR